MAAENFARALDLVLRHEGGYVDHPRDPGGATNRGITIATLSIWRGKQVTKQDVRDLSLAEAGLEALHAGPGSLFNGHSRMPAKQPKCRSWHFPLVWPTGMDFPAGMKGCQALPHMRGMRSSAEGLPKAVETAAS